MFVYIVMYLKNTVYIRANKHTHTHIITKLQLFKLNSLTYISDIIGYLDVGQGIPCTQ